MFVDCREASLIDCLKKLVETNPLFQTIEITTGSLDIGDIMIKEHELIFERKTLADLQASIRDGRYSEQGYRLSNSEFHPHNIIYLIEGDFNKNRQLDKNALFSSITALNHIKGFSVLRTMDTNETAFLLCNMFMKLQKEKKDKKVETLSFYLKPIAKEEDKISVEKKYSQFVKKQKSGNITENNIHSIMLSQIPGVSSTIADHFITTFSTIHGITEQIKTDRQVILDMKYMCEKTKKLKKINKNACENIIRFLG